LDGRRQESTWELNCESVTVCVSCPSCWGHREFIVFPRGRGRHIQCVCERERDRQTDRQTDRDRQRDRERII